MSFGNFGSKPMNNPKATKAPKAPGKKPFSSRTVIGVICIVLALLITFGVAPLVNRFTDQKVDIVRLKTDVQRGQIITADHLEIVNVGSYNLPNNVIKDGKAVVGKYAATDLYAGDYLFSSKLSTDNKSADDVLLGLGGEKVAISVNVANFAAGLSDKLENGDIVSVIIYDKDMYTSYTPAELKYVKVITTTTSDGVDKDEIVEGGKAATVTLLVTPEQAELLAHYNSVTTIHFALVYRGDADKADAYIKVQDDYLNKNPIDNTTKDETEEADNG
ncbi:MAG: Flp pilus assembly protein CpaB [Eubacteriales bacterium]